MVRAKDRGGAARRLLSPLAAAVCLTAATAGQAANFDEELRFLLETHPRIQAAQSRLAAAGHGVDAAVGEFFPTISASGDVGYSRVDSPTLRSSRGDAFEGRADRAALSADVTIFDGFRRYANLDRSELEETTAGLSLDATRQSILLSGVTAYLDVLRQRDLHGLARVNEDTIREQVGLEQERVRLGSGLQVDYLQAKTRLEVARELRVSIEGQMRVAHSQYEQVFGHPPQTAEMALPAAPAAALPASMDDAVAAARQYNPRLIASARQIDIAGANVRAASSNFFPEVDFVVEGSRQTNADGIAGVRRDFTAQVVATWSLSTGMTELSRVRQAREQQAAARSENTFTDREVADAVRTAWHQYQTARERRAILEDAVVSAEEVFTARQRLREEGRESVQNVLDAENEVNNARIQLTAARFDELLATYRVLYAVGALTPDSLGLSG